MTETREAYTVKIHRNTPWTCQGCGEVLGYIDKCGRLSLALDSGNVSAMITGKGVEKVYCTCGFYRRWYHDRPDLDMAIVTRAAALINGGMEPRQAVRQASEELEEG